MLCHYEVISRDHIPVITIPYLTYSIVYIMRSEAFQMGPTRLCVYIAVRANTPYPDVRLNVTSELFHPRPLVHC